uniref:Uncharacterized protein n=1 Tax=Siphoviridae sp. ctMCY8 TaxID=2827854 RepID=A0A8S5TAR7_9CAUD|nr:MAG TPA: hypothetical protein [Siphoviridae sp. ctMCY8]
MKIRNRERKSITPAKPVIPLRKLYKRKCSVFHRQTDTPSKPKGARQL